MPEVSEYKAAGKASGSYTKQRSSASDVEYEKDYSQRMYGRRISLIHSIGSSIGNILDIIDERRKLSAIEGYKQTAAELPGIHAVEEEYQPLGGFGELMGLDKKTRTKYISALTGRGLSDEMMHAIGRLEGGGYSTKYSDVERISRAMEKRIPVKTYEQADVSSQKEYERKMGMDEFSYEEVPIGKHGYATSDKAVDKVKGQPVVDQSQHGGPEYPLQWEFEEGGEWVDEWIKDNPNHPAYQEFLESQRKKGDDAVFGAIEGGEGKDIFEDIAGIKKGMSEFEKNIAMSENAPLFESGDISSSTYTDRYMDTGEDRPAWGFGSKDTGQIDRSFTASIEDMRANISNTESQLQKSIGKDEWESLPQSVRESVIEMGYIMGVSKLNKEFKKMMKALKEGDIRRAGMEATWRDVISGTKAGWISHVKEQRSDRILSGFRIPKKR